MKNFLFLLITSLLFIFNSCSCNRDGDGINIFKLEDDKNLGAQMFAFIESDSSGLQVLDTAKYSTSYYHLNRIKNVIINSGKLKHKDDFAWRARIIKNDSIINAFSTPGGYIYVYTGLIKYLDTEDEFAGVLAHEIAHADRRHSTAMLTKVYGISLLINIILGNDNDMVGRITQKLLSLTFSRSAELDADKHSVIYLCREDSPYQADGAAGFFKKMIDDEKSGSIPEFLSTHPNPPNRITNIKNIANEMGCKNIEHQTKEHSKEYLEFKNSLP